MSLPRPYRLPPPPPQAHGSGSQYQTVYDDSPPSSPTLSSVDEHDNAYISDTTRLVAHGNLGADFTPYPSLLADADLQRNSTTRYSAALPSQYARSDDNHDHPHEKGALLAVGGIGMPGTNALPSQLDIVKDGEILDPDDELYVPTTLRDRARNVFSSRGFANVLVMVLIVLGILVLFVIYPVISHFAFPPDETGFHLVNSTGQISGIPGMRSVIDLDTPEDVKHRQGFDGQNYHLVFSDEFNVEGRTFGQGDDPYWEAVDLHVRNNILPDVR